MTCQAIFENQFTHVRDACALAQAIVDTISEPLVVLDKDLLVIAASRSFYTTFSVTPKGTQGRLLYDLSDGAWDIPKLRVLLGKILPEHGAMADYEVQHEFPHLGLRTMSLSAREVFYEAKIQSHILLSIIDVTERRKLEHEKDALLKQKDEVHNELQHRIANSLQIIASIILMRTKTVDSEDARHHLKDAHHRIVSMAALQQHLFSTGRNGLVELRPYLTKLCDALSHSMIGDEQHIALNVSDGVDEAKATHRNAESIGLIVTELVMNSLKHAFKETTKNGRITVSYDVSGSNWKLTVADNGVGRPDDYFAQPKTGLGTGIVKALAKQMEAQVVTLPSVKGTTVTVTHATFSELEKPVPIPRARHNVR
jgi:chemotaxis protein methyltransferase CheR